MLVTYMEELFGQGFMTTEFGQMTAAILVVGCVFLIVKTFLGWFKEIF